MREWEEYMSQVKRLKGTKDLLQLSGEKKKVLYRRHSMSCPLYVYQFISVEKFVEERLTP